jgi:hypothetical protein
VSPILTRPVREQLEHDRVIRQLQGKYKRKTEVVINPGNEQNQSVTVGDLVVFPDLLVFAEGGRRLLVTVEVETGESVNAIEARAEWGVYSKLKVPLHLYVPPSNVDAVRRLCAEYQILVSEIWTYTTSFDQVRFTMVHRDANAPVVKIPEKPDKPAPPIRQAQGRPEQGRVTKPSAPAAKPASKSAAKKPAPAKAKPKAKAKPAAKKAKPAPKAKPKKGAKKRR